MNRLRNGSQYFEQPHHAMRMPESGDGHVYLKSYDPWSHDDIRGEYKQAVHGGDSDATFKLGVTKEFNINIDIKL